MDGVLITPHTAGHGPHLDERRFESCATIAGASHRPALRNVVDKARWFCGAGTVGLNVWSRLVDATFPYFDRVVSRSTRSGSRPRAVRQPQGRRGLDAAGVGAVALSDKLCGHEVLCNSFRNPAHTAKMVATAQALSGGRHDPRHRAGWNQEEYLAYGWPYLTARERIASWPTRSN